MFHFPLSAEGLIGELTEGKNFKNAKGFAHERGVPKEMYDEVLFLTVKLNVLDLLKKPDTAITYFGFAPDNTADNQDEILLDGVYSRIIT